MAHQRIFLAATLVVAVAACDHGCQHGAATATPQTGAAGTQVVDSQPGHHRGEGITNEGDRVIFGDTRPPGAQRPSHEGDRAAQDQAAHLVRTPTSPDPEHGDFTLDEAVAGMPIDGQLVAEIGTELGTMECDLFADKAPRAVANFIGLARGLRPWWDARAGMWQQHRAYYHDLTIHRVIPGYLIQGGDYLGDGSGSVGYELADEDTGMRHDRAGLLCTASVGGPNHAGGQFYITDGPAPQLDAAGGTIFGRCVQTDVIARVARLAQTGAPDNAPLTPMHLTHVIIRRVAGGATAARPLQPTDPSPYQEHHASPGPSELHQQMGPMPPPPGLPQPAPQPH